MSNGKSSKQRKAAAREAKADTAAQRPVRERKAKAMRVVTAEQLASHFGVTGKAFRKWLRSGDTILGANDGKYTHYGFDLDSKSGTKLVAQAQARFKPSK